jgi:hypothetical protein
MIDPIPTRSPTEAAACNPGAKKRWVGPTLTRIDSKGAENSANPVGTDAIISMGS